MFKKISLAIIFLTAVLTSFIGLAQAGDYCVEIVKATGLKNTDIKKNGKTDPYVKMYQYAPIAQKPGDVPLPRKFLWKLIGTTPVKADTLNPVWNSKFTVSSENTKIFEIWDKDPVLDKFLGVGQFSWGEITTRSLELFGRFGLAEPAMPSVSFKKPGKLVVKITQGVCGAPPPQVKTVPNVLGMEPAAAKSVLSESGFNAVMRTLLIESPLFTGKVTSQNPKAGVSMPVKQTVTCAVGLRPTYIVPNVIGSLLWQARRILSPFRHVKIEGRKGSVNPDKWFKVGAQDPVGRKVYRDAKITLFMDLPADDFKFTVPDVMDKKINDAVRDLRDAHLDSFKIIKQRTAVKEENGIVLEQDPKGGEEVGIVAKENSYPTWTTDKPVSITVGWYADGKSLYSASPVGLDKDVEFKYDEPGTGRFFIFDVKENGYLIVESKQSPSVINPQAEYYMLENGKYEMKSRYNSGLPSSFRVTPGQWVVSLLPEMSESKSDEKSVFAFHFIKEFDDGEPNESFEQAVTAPLNSDIVMGFLGGSRGRDSDFYKFKTEAPGYLDVTYEKLPIPTTFYGDSRNLGLQFSVYNSSKESLGLYYPPAAPKFMLPGEYFIDFNSIESRWNNTPYKFSLNFHKAEDLGEPNDTQGTAYKINIPAYIPVAYTSRGDEDYYMLSSDKPGYAVLSHDRDLPFDTNFSFYDENGDSQGHTLDLPAAVRIDRTRLVSIKAVTESQYVLKDLPGLFIDFIPATEDPYEPNDDIKAAAAIPRNKKVEALLVPRNDVDNYEFTVKRSRKIKIEISQTCEIPLKGQILLPDGTVFKNNVYFPYEMEAPKGSYILQFSQEGGFNRFCGEKYTLQISESGKHAK